MYLELSLNIQNLFFANFEQKKPNKMLVEYFYDRIFEKVLDACAFEMMRQ